jgi:ribosomal protein S18 acetylase RimI-like enzyme
MGITYQETNENIDYGQVNRVLTELFGTKKAGDVNHTRTVFERSQHFVFAFDNEALVGLARAISDGEWAVIYNFGVVAGYRDQPVGSEILKRMTSQLKGQHIFAIVLPDEISFYERNGFRRTKTAFTYVGFGDGADAYGPDHFLPEGYKFENEFYPVELPFATHRIPSKKRDVELVYSNERAGIDYRRVNEIIAGAFAADAKIAPGEVNEESIARTKYLFDISDYVSFAYDRGQLIGVARAITDGAQEAYIQNVAVDPDYQGYGVGWQVVVNLGEEIRRDGLNPFLHTHPGAVGFYNRKGFRRNKTAMDFVDETEHMPPEVEQGFYVPTGYQFIDEL